MQGIPSTSRNGYVLRFQHPVTITVDRPWQKVVTCPKRDANPFFHLIEAMAMLNNFNDVELLSALAANMKNFSDNGETYNAFYGTRLRNWHMHDDGHLPTDQLERVIAMLKADPTTRHAVAQIWDVADNYKDTKDKACNLCLVFEVVNGKLNMTSYNRSNDAIWGGVTGANIVHLPFFQEYVTCALGLKVGWWSHTAANLHVYTRNPKWEALRDTIKHPSEALVKPAQYYEQAQPLVSQLFNQGQQSSFDAECRDLLNMMLSAIQTGNLSSMAGKVLSNPFLRDTVAQAFLAWFCHSRFKDSTTALDTASHIACSDWRQACTEWLTRRNHKSK